MSDYDFLTELAPRAPQGFSWQVSPATQAERDQVARGIVEQEIADNPDDPYLHREHELRFGGEVEQRAPSTDPIAGLMGYLDQAAPEQFRAAEQGGFFANAKRGFSTAFEQVPQLGYGLAALGAATLESMVGRDGLVTAAKNWAAGKYQEWGDEIAQDAQPNDEWDVAYDKATEGDFGALVDWLGHGIGYVAGQGIQMLATGGVGGVVGKVALKGAAEKFAGGMVAKEATTLGIEKAGEATARAAIQKTAVANVANRLGQMAALGATAYGMEGGEIGGELVSENLDRELSGSELGRAFGATFLAGSLEFAADKLGFDTVLGKNKFGLGEVAGLKGRAARGAAGVAVNVPAEYATEYGQTITEEWGKGHEENLFEPSPETLRQAGNAAMLGALGGAVHGVVGGVLSPAEQRRAEANQAISDIGKATTVDEATEAAFRATSLPPDVEPELFGETNPYDVGGYISRAESGQETGIDSAQFGLFGGGGEVSNPDLAAAGATEEARARDEAEWQSLIESETRDQEFRLAQIQREAQKTAELEPLADQRAEEMGRLPDQRIASAQAATDEEPTAMELAFRKAREKAPAETFVSPKKESAQPKLSLAQTPSGAPLIVGKAEHLSESLPQLRSLLPGMAFIKRREKDGSTSFLISKKADLGAVQQALDTVNAPPVMGSYAVEESPAPGEPKQVSYQEGSGAIQSIAEAGESRGLGVPSPGMSPIPDVPATLGQSLTTAETIPEGEPREFRDQYARAREIESDPQVRKTLAKWKAAEVHFVETEADLPDVAEKLFSQQGGAIKGAWASGTNEIYLVAGAHQSAEATLETLRHEAIGHFSQERLQKSETYKRTLNNVRLLVQAKNRKALEWARKVDSSQPGLSEEQRIKEILAAAAESGEYRLIPSLARLFKQIFNQARLWLKGQGFDLSEAFVEQRIFSALRKGERALRKPAQHEDVGASGERTEPALMYSRASESQSVRDLNVSDGPARPEPGELPAWLRSMPEQTQEAARKAGIWTPKRPLKERLAQLRDNAVKSIQQGLVDQFAPLRELDERAYVLARLTKSSDAPLEALLLYGKPFLNNAGAIDVNLEKGGLIGVLQQLKGEHDRFFAWIAGNRAAQLKAEGRENLFTDEDISSLKLLSEGTMEDGRSRKTVYRLVHEQFNGYGKAVLDIAEKAGTINAEDRKIWERDFYVPFYRVMEDGEFKGPKNVSGLVNQYAFKKLKGGTETLNDLMQNTMRNWSHLVSASLKNQASAAAIKTAEKAGIAVPVQLKQKDSVFFLENGEEKHYVVEDPFILDAITSLEWAGWNNPAMKWMQRAKHYLTMGVTISPTFKVRNLIRDQISAIGLNPVSYNLMGNLVDGWKGTDKDSAEYAKMLAGGGLMRFGTFLEDDRAEHTKRLINRGVDADTILDSKGKVTAALKNGWDWWQEVGDRSENITRAAIYKQRYAQLLKEGKPEDEAHLMASFAARDSMDFSQQGAWASIRFLAQLVPFLNARIVGLGKIGKEGVAPTYRLLTGNAEGTDKQKAMRFGAVVGAVSLASIALLLAYRDDEDWKRREEWDRDAYWWFKVGGTAYRIPKPFEIGAIGTIAERGLDLMLSGMDKESQKLFVERMGAMITQTFAMNPIPQLVKPLIDLYANTDSFTGREIETAGMERLSKAQRIGPHTSATAQAAGKLASIVGLSPVQIDFLVDSYFAWLGTHAVMTADFVIRPMMGLPNKPSWKWPDDYFVLGDFSKDLPERQSKYVTKFYQQAREIQQAMADIRYHQSVGNLVKARELMEENKDKDKLRLELLYANAQQQMFYVNKRIRQVQFGKATPEAKRDQIDLLTLRRNEIAELTERRRAALRERN